MHHGRSISNRVKSRKLPHEDRSYSWFYSLWAVVLLGRPIKSKSFYSRMHLQPWRIHALSANHHDHSRGTGGQVIGSYAFSGKPQRVSKTRQGAMALFDWQATIAMSQCHRRALVASFRVIPCKTKAHCPGHYRCLSVAAYSVGWS